MNEHLSAQPCGCDEGARHECAQHTKARIIAEIDKGYAADVYGGSPSPQQPPQTKPWLAMESDPIVAPMSQQKQAFITGHFTVKDSGARQQFDSGMVRDVTTDKTDYSLVLDGPMFTRWAEHLTKGAKKYAKRNWMKAGSQEELDRFRESALRHFLQWYRGEVDEDHASAILFNVNGAEYTKGKVGVVVQPEECRPFRASEVGRKGCPSNGGRLQFRCEREIGHSGKHTAWEDYANRIPYKGGEW